MFFVEPRSNGACRLHVSHMCVASVCVRVCVCAVRVRAKTTCLRSVRANRATHKHAHGVPHMIHCVAYVSSFE